MTGSRRLLLAAALCAFALGLGWESTPGSEGYVSGGYITPGSCYSDADGYMTCDAGTYTAGYYLPGTPDGAARGYEADARLVLVPAVAALAWAARRRTRTAERVVTGLAVALAYVSLRAGVDGQTSAALVGVVAALLVASVARSRRPPIAGGVAPPRPVRSSTAGPSAAGASGSF